MKHRIPFRLPRRFSLSTLLLTVTLVAMLCGWMVDRHQLGKRLEREVSQASLLRENLALATWTNYFYAQMDHSDPQELQRTRRHQLFVILLSLLETERFESGQQQGVSLVHAANSLELLSCDSVDQVRQIVPEADFLPAMEEAFLDPNHPQYRDIEDFINRAFDRRRRQPQYPARIWIEAVHDGDAAKLATAFSSAIQKQSNDNDWSQRLKSYQNDLATKLGDYQVADFSFLSITSFDKTGSVTVSYEGTEIRELSIVKEGDQWKIEKP